jgi:hypothetical protein
MRVVCVKQGPKYGPEWVLKLRNMVARHLPIKHEFVCMTDDPIPGVKCLPLAHGLTGWWSKLSLFSGVLDGDNLYFDLDVVISDSIGPLAGLLELDRMKLWALDDFSYGFRNPRKGMTAEQKRFLGGDSTINSSVMLWNGDAARAVWDRFTPEVMKIVHGDQNWVTQALWPNVNLIPESVAGSYKYGKLKGEPRRPITIFHGDPKPDALRDAWILENWR